MLAEKASYLQSILILSLHSYSQGLDSAQQQKCRVRIHAAPQSRAQLVNLVDQVAASSGDAANDVGVSAKIFRSGRRS